MKQTLDRYCSLQPEEKLALAMKILYDVLNTWDDHNLAHYPDGMPSFDEFLCDLGNKLYDIRWHHGNTT